MAAFEPTRIDDCQFPSRMVLQERRQVDSNLSGVSDQLLEIIVCPRDKKPFLCKNGRLTCPHGHQYAIVDGVPVLLLPEVRHTHPIAIESLEQAESGALPPLPRFDISSSVDPYVQYVIGQSNGSMYQSLSGRLKEYPIPELRMPRSNGDLLLDIGCSWGRWSVAAQRAGYRSVGIDPSLDAVRAAYRVARQLGTDPLYVVGDSRFLPFRNQAFDAVFSYSVLQHLSKSDVKISVDEIRRVLKVAGSTMVQMPNAFGVRSLYHQVRRGFRETRDFEVRYWVPKELRMTFGNIGPVEISVDGFFSLNAQLYDVHMLPRRYRCVVYASEALRRISSKLHSLMYFADSLYVTMRKSP